MPTALTAPRSRAGALGGGEAGDVGGDAGAPPLALEPNTARITSSTCEHGIEIRKRVREPRGEPLRFVAVEPTGIRSSGDDRMFASAAAGIPFISSWTSNALGSAT